MFVGIGMLDLDRLIRPGAHSHLGEPGCVNADDVGGQNPRLDAALPADVEGDDRYRAGRRRPRGRSSRRPPACRGRRRRRGIRRAAARAAARAAGAWGPVRADRPAGQAAPAARGGKVRARPGSDAGGPVEADIAAGAGLDLVDRGLTHAQPHDCDRPCPAPAATRSGGSVGPSVKTGTSSLGRVEWNGLVRILEVDDLGHQPALVDRRRSGHPD